MDKEELYALARGVVGERCEELEKLLRPSDEGRLQFRTEAELVFHLDLVGRAGAVGVELTEREARGFLALAAMEWMLTAPDVPWLEGGATLMESEKNSRLIASIERLHYYLDDSGKASLHRLVQRLKDSTERRAAERAARAQIHAVAGIFRGVFGSDGESGQQPQKDRQAEPQETRHPPTEEVTPFDPQSRGPDASPAPHRERQEGTPPKAAAGSTSTTEQGSKALVAGARGGRRDLMAAAIEVAQRACSDPTDAVQVWLELRSMAERRVQPLRGTTEDGIQWVDSSDAPKTLNIGGLRSRLRRANAR